jgi:hypothetical protein
MHIVSRTRTKYGETDDETKLPEAMKRAQEQLKWLDEHESPAKKHYIVIEFDHDIGWWCIYIEWRYKNPTYADEVYQDQDVNQLQQLDRTSKEHAQKPENEM